MKDLFQHINKVFENRVRLALLSILMVNDAVDFNSLKQTLNVTDGNLSTHMATLEKHRYVTVRKKFKGRKPLTTYSATPEGRRAFREHLNALERLIKEVQ